MASLFENAVASIRMGVEDYRLHDPDRDISAVRNFYAGVLLLAKEALIRKAPLASPHAVIGARHKPVSDGAGGVTLAVVGDKTIDFQTISDRFKDFGMTIDHKALSDLNRIRNDMEHNYTSSPAAAIRSAIAKGFPVVSSLFRQMNEEPAAHLDDVWATMLETTEFYNHEVVEARRTLEKVNWISATIANARLKCIDCGSELLEQVDASNTQQSSIEFRCRNCQALPETADVIEATVEQELGGEAYLRVKETGEDGPIYECPPCQKNTYIDTEEQCANCGEALDYQSTCLRCGSDIPIRDFLEGMDGGLCSYCNHQASKILADD